MKSGLRLRNWKGRIDYKELRRCNAGAARRAVLEYLKTDPNISETARVFGITRAVIYDILKKKSARAIYKTAPGYPDGNHGILPVEE